jgi:hypothetical protein
MKVIQKNDFYSSEHNKKITHEKVNFKCVITETQIGIYLMKSNHSYDFQLTSFHFVSVEECIIICERIWDETKILFVGGSE